jgi:type II secretory pathway predicted ATPase ExeA
MLTMIQQKVDRDFINGRTAELQKARFGHPRFNTALAQIEDDIAAAEAGLKAQARLVCGHSGSGKTTLAECVVERYPVVSSPDGDVRPVVHVELAEATTKKAMVSAIFAAMGYDNRTRLTANEIIEEIADKVERLGVKMILIDEAHHLTHGRELRPITEFLKSLLNRIRCNIVLVGLPELQEMRREEQFDRRLRPDLALAPYNWEKWEERLQFFAVLARFERLLGLEKPSNLASEKNAARMYVATGGHIGIVVKYLVAALELALRKDDKRISTRLLADIHASWHPSAMPPKTLNFSAAASPASDATLEEAESAVGRPCIDSATNPFACTFEKLNEIWEQRQAIFIIEEDKRLRTRRGRGKGLKPPAAFS